ncbi:MAG TPA: C40 family peptidase [Burkholderiales bacterium]|nr:C40 family peptidase [Burkholderiales bacterium]
MIAWAMAGCAHMPDSLNDALSPLAAVLPGTAAKPSSEQTASTAEKAPAHSGNTTPTGSKVPQTEAAAAADDIPVEEMAVHYAMEMVGRPYKLGSTSPSRGFDACGLVHYSFAKAGVKMPRAHEEQRKVSGRVFVSLLRVGDLVYFNLDGKKNSHVGIYIGDGRFVHASPSGKRVRMDRIDAPYWQQILSEARRLDARRVQASF